MSEPVQQGTLNLQPFKSTSNFTNVKACVLVCKKSIVIVMYDSFKSSWVPPRGLLASVLNLLKTRWLIRERFVSCFWVVKLKLSCTGLVKWMSRMLHLSVNIITSPSTPLEKKVICFCNNSFIPFSSNFCSCSL